MFKVERHPQGPRVYALGLRIHHGLTGCALLVVGVAKHDRTLTVCGLVLVSHDLPDFPWRLRERALVSPPCRT